MFEVTGHFILHDDAPHLVLTDLPVALRQMYLLEPSVTDAGDGDPGMNSPRLGDWNAHSADGVRSLKGVLYALGGLGGNGQRLALEQVERARSRPPAQGAHTVRLDDKGALLNWVITPKVLMNVRR